MSLYANDRAFFISVRSWWSERERQRERGKGKARRKTHHRNPNGKNPENV
jgi:hypothetical protein